MALTAMSLRFIEQGKVERGIELYTLVSSHPNVANSLWFEKVCGQHVEAATSTLSPELFKIARRQGRALDWSQTMEVLLPEPEEMERR